MPSHSATGAGAEWTDRLKDWIWRLPRLSGRYPEAPRRPQILVDVSVIYDHDSKTGIQRVVRAVWVHLQVAVTAEYEVVAVAATRRKSYRVVPLDFLEHTERPSVSRLSEVEPRRPGDLFFGLDLAAHIIPRRASELLRWQRQGCQLAFMVYDLLPVQNPAWFSNKLARNFARWLHFVAQHADRALCISEAVADNLAQWLASNIKRTNPLAVHAIRLGGDLAASVPSAGLTANDVQALQGLGSKPILLCVGTIEPRKGHAILLDAFEHLSSRHPTCHLVVVGRPGWKTQLLQERMRKLESRNAGFTWFSDASDELLIRLYERCALVVVPSIDEGFGLPVVEALQYGCRVLARDIPVFRELQAPGVAFFAVDDVQGLANDIIALVAADGAAPLRSQPSSWRACADEIVEALGLFRQAN